MKKSRPCWINSLQLLKAIQKKIYNVNHKKCKNERNRLKRKLKFRHIFSFFARKFNLSVLKSLYTIRKIQLLLLFTPGNFNFFPPKKSHNIWCEAIKLLPPLLLLHGKLVRAAFVSEYSKVLGILRAIFKRRFHQWVRNQSRNVETITINKPLRWKSKGSLN